MSNLICPSCGSATSFNPVLVTKKGVLEERSSGETTNRGMVSVTLVQPYEYGVAQYGILYCAACGKHIVVEKAEYAEEGDWSVVYPLPHELAPEEIPEPIKGEYEEACLCLAIHAYRASVSMCQVALESLWRDKEASNLKELYERGIISKQLFDYADEVRSWGNIAKHEPIPDVVSEEDSKQLIEYMKAILDHVYVQPARLDALRQKRKEVEK